MTKPPRERDRKFSSTRQRRGAAKRIFELTGAFSKYPGESAASPQSAYTGFFHEIREPAAFRLFIRLCAGATGNEFNAYVVSRQPPFFANIRKRLVKSPKIYFYDTGLACLLIGVRPEEQLATHPLRGALFENLVVAEFVKHAAAHNGIVNFRNP